MGDEDRFYKALDDPELEQKLEETARLIAGSRHLVVFTGAGVSTESGIPDYRGPRGVWTLRDRGERPDAPDRPWDMVQPNQAHVAIHRLQELGLLKFLISQNVDNLHLKSGIRPDIIAELHGNTTLMKCIDCDARFSQEELGWDERRLGPGYRTSKPIKGQPACPKCQGRIISSVVNFGDPMPDREMEESEEHAARADVFISIGSTLQVTPAATFPVIARRAGAKLIILNLGPTALDDLADIHLSGKAGGLLGRIVERVEGLVAG